MALSLSWGPLRVAQLTGDSCGPSLMEGGDRTGRVSVPHASILCGESHFQGRHPQHWGAVPAWKNLGLSVASWVESSHVRHLCPEERTRCAARSRSLQREGPGGRPWSLDGCELALLAASLSHGAPGPSLSYQSGEL